MPTSKPDNLVLVDGSDVAINGWDPYEVWRTRVLLPRLAEKATWIDASANAEVEPPPCSVRGVPKVLVRAATALE